MTAKRRKLHCTPHVHIAPEVAEHFSKSKNLKLNAPVKQHECAPLDGPYGRYWLLQPNMSAFGYANFGSANADDDVPF
jgi:hypothetical protein